MAPLFVFNGVWWRGGGKFRQFLQSPPEHTIGQLQNLQMSQVSASRLLESRHSKLKDFWIDRNKLSRFLIKEIYYFLIT